MGAKRDDLSAAKTRTEQLEAGAKAKGSNFLALAAQSHRRERACAVQAAGSGVTDLRCAMRVKRI